MGTLTLKNLIREEEGAGKASHWPPTSVPEFSLSTSYVRGGGLMDVHENAAVQCCLTLQVSTTVASRRYDEGARTRIAI